MIWKTSLVKDPKVRKDGRCARKGCSRKVEIKGNAKLAANAGHLLIDPFCSTECAKIYHGVKVPTYSAGTGQ